MDREKEQLIKEYKQEIEQIKDESFKKSEQLETSKK